MKIFDIRFRFLMLTWIVGIAIALTFYTLFLGANTKALALSIKGYTPFKIEVRGVTVHNQLILEESDNLFFLKKNRDLILVIPKYEEFGDEGITFRHKERYYGAFTIENTVELKSDNPNVVLCYFINPYEDGQKYECGAEVTTNVARIDVKPQDLKSLAEASGVSDKEVKADLLYFNLDGRIDGQEFLVQGTVIYDNTEEARNAYYKETKSLVESWDRTNYFTGFIVVVVPFIVGAIILWIIWRLVIRRKANKP